MERAYRGIAAWKQVWAGNMPPMGGEGSIVEADETYFGPRTTPVTYSRPRARKNWKPTKSGKSGPGGKRSIMALVERGGSVRSFHLEKADKPTINYVMAKNILRGADLHTDESRLHGDAKLAFKHSSVKHSAGEYVRGNVHTNSAEGVFSIFKRGMKGVYQHCAEKHLHRYLAEFDSRHNNRIALGGDDTRRADRALTGIIGKRLTYRTIS
jgi:hypothetical protein